MKKLEDIPVLVICYTLIMHDNTTEYKMSMLKNTKVVFDRKFKKICSLSFLFYHKYLITNVEIKFSSWANINFSITLRLQLFICNNSSLEVTIAHLQL